MLVGGDRLAEAVGVDIAAGPPLEDGGVADGTGREAAEIVAADGGRRVQGGRADHVVEAHHERYKDAKGIVALVNKGQGAQFKNVSIWNAKPKK